MKNSFYSTSYSKKIFLINIVIMGSFLLPSWCQSFSSKNPGDHSKVIPQQSKNKIKSKKQEQKQQQKEHKQQPRKASQEGGEESKILTQKMLKEKMKEKRKENIQQQHHEKNTNDYED